jgi:hypothetical protein
MLHLCLNARVIVDCCSVVVVGCLLPVFVYDDIIWKVILKSSGVYMILEVLHIDTCVAVTGACLRVVLDLTYGAILLI